MTVFSFVSLFLKLTAINIPKILGFLLVQKPRQHVCFSSYRSFFQFKNRFSKAVFSCRKLTTGINNSEKYTDILVLGRLHVSFSCKFMLELVVSHRFLNIDYEINGCRIKNFCVISFLGVQKMISFTVQALNRCKIL